MQPTKPNCATVSVLRCRGPASTPDEDTLAAEEPLEIRLNGVALAITMRTPGDDEALAVGFLLTEGIIDSAVQVWDIRRCAGTESAGNIIEVVVPPERARGLESGRQRYATSSCGICGRASIDSLRALMPALKPAPVLPMELLRSLPQKLRRAQNLFDRTGGVHAAALFTRRGKLLEAAEDIGRHNAVDKAVGRGLLNGTLADSVILMVSGRVGFEIVQKALAARIPVVCSVSAPSHLAVSLARESGMLLIGFLRGDTLNVYSGNLAQRGRSRAQTEE